MLIHAVHHVNIFVNDEADKNKGIFANEKDTIFCLKNVYQRVMMHYDVYTATYKCK